MSSLCLLPADSRGLVSSQRVGEFNLANWWGDLHENILIPNATPLQKNDL